MVIALSFLLVILAGAILLSLPISSASGSGTNFLDAYFTANSATCVTGLVTLDTGPHFSVFGKIIILLLMQIGGLGYMTFSIFMVLIFKNKLFISQKLVVQEALNINSTKDVIIVLKKVFGIVFFCEGLGAAILFIRWLPDFGYAKALSDRFSVGAQVKWVKQDLEDSVIPVTDSTTTTKSYELSPFAFDFGTLFKTGFKSLAFGMSIRNFSKEISFEQEGFQLPLVYTMGVSMDLMDFFEMTGSDQSLYLTIDATHYRSHPEQILVGLDYKIMNLLSLRGGLATNNDEDNFTFGFGVSQFGLMVDYAYTPFGVFDQVQRVTARFSL